MTGLRERLYVIIFETGTPAGKAFDVALLVAILASVLAVLLESMAGIRQQSQGLLRAAEWVFTGLFTVEYLLRLYCVRRPVRYALSFYGLIDLLAVLPTYLSLLFTGTQSLAVVRVLRLLRVFRVLKLTHFLSEADVLRRALISSLPKITVFVGFVLTIVVVMGAAMHLIEGEEAGFTNIPESMYWAIVTLTTVGYGDIAPATATGKILASGLMVMGYGIIAVPTGIVTAEMVGHARRRPAPRTCRECLVADHPPEARFCYRCGEALPDPTASR